MARIEFAKKNSKRNWRQVMFTDRCKFYWRFPGSAVKNVNWCLRSERHREGAYHANKPMCVNVYGGITPARVTALHVVAGTSKHVSQYHNLQGKKSKNITLAEYRDVLGKTLLPQGRRIFCNQGRQDFVFQQDNDPSHKRVQGILNAWNTDHMGQQVKLLEDWPGNSPDFNPIENVWAWVDSKVAQIKCHTFEEFCSAVERTFASVPRSMLENLYGSMPRRMEECIEMDGHRTSY